MPIGLHIVHRSIHKRMYIAHEAGLHRRSYKQDTDYQVLIVVSAENLFRK